jgi:hypothetical protein
MGNIFCKDIQKKTDELNEKLRYNYRTPSPKTTKKERKRRKYREKVKDKKEWDFIFSNRR